MAITEQGAEVRLDDGREGFVAATDFSWDEWIGKRNLTAGDSLEFDVLGMMLDGRLFLAFKPIREGAGALAQG